MSDPTPAPASGAASAAPLPLPAQGGCWVRQPDGSLARDPDWPPPEAAEADWPPAQQPQQPQED